MKKFGAFKKTSFYLFFLNFHTRSNKKKVSYAVLARVRTWGWNECGECERVTEKKTKIKSHFSWKIIKS